MFLPRQPQEEDMVRRHPEQIDVAPEGVTDLAVTDFRILWQYRLARAQVVAQRPDRARFREVGGQEA